ncbi:hypothetical protein B0H11DRAFT_2282268 [Mycena galericulata]|nr:hypothetical protein B0H11DRAFT_2282268 [Mycena galericulata]
MPVCQGCSIDFYGLTHEICYKCQELAGKSEPEKGPIRNKGQCMGCAVVYGELQASLCNSCCQNYAKADSIPSQILKLNGAHEQIQGFQTSDFTSELWEIAQGYKRTASDHRLGIPRVQNSSLLKAANAATLKKATPGISKGAALLQEMQDKRDQGKKVRFTITLCKSTEKKKGTTAIVPIPEIRPVENINEDEQIYTALDQICLHVQEFHAKLFPTAAKIRRHMVNFYAQETVTRYYNIDENQLTEGTVSDFLRYFRVKGHISVAQYEAKQLELKLVVDESTLYPAHDSGFTAPSSAVPRSRSRTSTAPVLRSSRVSGFSNEPSNGRSSATARPTRASAWPKSTPTFSRPCDMVELKFKRYDIKFDGINATYSMRIDQPTESVFVPKDWMQGRDDPKESFKTGFLGSGSAKNVVYARIGSEEYALGQARDFKLDNAAHLAMLFSELKNLHYGDTVAKDFFQYADETNVSVPPFRFNVEGAVLGALEPCLNRTDDVLLFTHFLATRLLPCGKADEGIQKFTGNSDCGAPPTDPMTMAIHAFSHYVPLMTDQNLLLCDLQGMWDRKGVMTLVDPQSHSSEVDSARRPYWDMGPKAIKAFLAHHLKVCHENDICNRLRLQDLEFEHNAGPGLVRPRSPSKSPEQRKRARVDRTDQPYRHGWPDSES